MSKIETVTITLKEPVFLQAYILTEAKLINTNLMGVGGESGQVGDWVVIYPGDIARVFTPEDFHKTYVVLDPPNILVACDESLDLKSSQGVQ